MGPTPIIVILEQKKNFKKLRKMLLSKPRGSQRVIKNFKVTLKVLKGEEFKWSLVSDMAEYSNHHFISYITDKDIEEQLLTENPVLLNL